MRENMPFKTRPEILVCMLAVATILADISLHTNITAVLGSITIAAAVGSLMHFARQASF